SFCSLLLCPHTATTEFYTLSLHDALPILNVGNPQLAFDFQSIPNNGVGLARLEFIINNNIGIHPKACLAYPDLPEDLRRAVEERSEEHTSELQSRFDLVCRLLLEKKKKRQ